MTPDFVRTQRRNTQLTTRRSSSTMRRMSGRSPSRTMRSRASATSSSSSYRPSVRRLLQRVSTSLLPSCPPTFFSLHFDRADLLVCRSNVQSKLAQSRASRPPRTSCVTLVYLSQNNVSYYVRAQKYSPVTGTVEDVNTELGDQPSLINKSAEDKGEFWILGC